MSTPTSIALLTGVPAGPVELVAATTTGSLAAPPRAGDTAASCRFAVAPRRLQWVNTPVLIEAMERQRQGRLPRSMQLWLQQLLEQPAGSAPPELPGGAGPSTRIKG